VVRPTGNFRAVIEVFDMVPVTVKFPEIVPPDVSSLPAFRFEKLVSTSIIVRGVPFVCLKTNVDIMIPYWVLLLVFIRILRRIFISSMLCFISSTVDSNSLILDVDFF
jgi:hypothetical protein